MTTQPLHRVIESVARTGDLASLAEHLADDVELQIAIAVDPPPPLWRSGKRSVLEHLQRMRKASPYAQQEPGEIFASGERIVASSDERLSIGNGLSMQSACTLIFDVRGGSITRLGIQFDLHPELESALGEGAGAPRWSEESNDVVTAEVEVQAPPNVASCLQQPA